MGREMMGCEKNVAAEEAGFEEFDEWFIRRKIEELLRKALFPSDGYRGLEATRNEVARELAEIRGNYARYGEAYVEYVGRLGEGEEKAIKEAEKAMREALEHVDELEIRRTGRAHWKAKLPGRSWRLYVHLKPSGYWEVEIRLHLRVVKLRLPDTLRLPPELLRAAQEGWIMGDASYRADREEVTMTTAQTWQVASFPGFWPGKEVAVYVDRIEIHETRVSVKWYVVVKGVRDAPRWWSLSKKEKQGIILAEIEAANRGEIDIFRALKLALLYVTDGMYPGSSNTARHVLDFAVGQNSRRVRTEGAVKVARLLYEKVPQLLAYMVASGCQKAEFLASLASVKPRHYAPRYLEVAGVKMTLLLVGASRALAAVVYVTEDNEETLRGFPERARREGLEVRKVKVSKGRWGYRAGQKELLRYADKRPIVYDTLIAFVEERLGAMPLNHPARPSVERLLERLKKARERALRKLGDQDAKE
ncbi:hypothetical protein [Thermofilum pendens]|uniref:Uncharacterized protein n=1 Tax=Thermofilum pendens (strain DSM 2475 / Hrk 5) TaxID=368408 RepID=A1RY20_THEPD|nr:hypothetical protein [Thermofilum pendens]ABL78100.1 hypothetical protein Tpen_0698 [Thermofilum pendens Hrk 5]